MALLMYNLTPATQLLRNSSFESPLAVLDGALNWVKNDNALRQDEVAAFGDFAVEMSPGGSVYQRSVDLNLSGSVTVSILSKGSSSTQSSALFVKYEKIDALGNTLVEKQAELTSISSSEFNIAYTVFVLPGIASEEGKLTFFTTEGSGTYFLDNAKVEQNGKPTRWSPFEGEPDIDVPASFRVDTPFKDSNDKFGSPINVTDIVSFPRKVTINPDGSVPQQTRGGVPVSPPAGVPSGPGSAAGVMVGKPVSDAFNQFHEFSVCLRQIRRERLDQVVNRENIKFFPNDKEPPFCEFKREKLQNKVDDPKINSRQKTFLLAAKTKMATQRRMFEVRNHGRMDQYTFGFNSLWHDYKHLRNEDGMIRQMVEG